MNGVRKTFGVILVLFICTFSVRVSYAEEYEYDKLNRVTKITYGDGSYVEYTYDANGNITKVNTVNINDKSDSSDDTSNNNASGDTSNDDSSSDESNSNVSEGSNSSNDNKTEDNSSSNSDISKDNDKTKDDSNTSSSTSKDNKTDNHSNASKDNNKPHNTSNKKNNIKNYSKIEIIVHTKDKTDIDRKKEYFEEWLIVYPLTFKELMEQYKGLYNSFVVNSPLDKHSWLEYAYTLYYKDYVVGGVNIGESNEGVEDKKYIKIIDYFMVNEFYRDYIKFKEKIYELSSYFREVKEFIVLEIKE